jgi:hypothetical protein
MHNVEQCPQVRVKRVPSKVYDMRFLWSAENSGAWSERINFALISRSGTEEPTGGLFARHSDWSFARTSDSRIFE